MNAIDRILSEPWAIVPTAVPSMLAWFDATLSALRHPNGPAITRSAIAGDVLAAEKEQRDWLADYVHQRAPLQVDASGIATISITGPLARGLTKIEKRLGASDYNDIMADVATALADDQVRAIVLAIESPGGSVVGEEEAREAIAAAARQKPVVASIESCGCSAAYALACGASGIVASPSAIVGSIGTIATFADWSQFYESMGIKVSVLTASQSDLKATWSPLAPMTAEQRTDAQRQLDSAGQDFIDWVKSRRRNVPMEAMRGQWFSARDAAQHSLVDQLGNRADAAQVALVIAQLASL